MKSKPAVVLLFLIFAFLSSSFITSCNNSPVTSNTETTFDSARYNWERIDIPYSNIRDFCVVDTNHIYFIRLSNNQFITYIDRQFNSVSYTEENFNATCIGNVNNMVYIGGDNIVNDKPMIQRWNGFALENVPVPDYGTDFNLTFAFPMSSGEIWFTGTSGKILRVSGNNVYHYEFDSTRFVINISSINGVIYAVTSKDTEQKNTSILRIYKFQSGTWSIAKEQTFSPGAELDFFSPFVNSIENHMYGQWGIGNIYDYDGSNLNKVLTLPEMIINWRIAGTGLNEFTFPGWRDDFVASGDGSVFNWNGNKMSVELRYYQTGLAYTTFYKNNSYLVLCMTNNPIEADFFYIGKR